MNLTPLSGSQMCLDLPATRLDWLWDGVILSKALTLLVSPSKVGKTTLMSHLLRQMQTGGDLFGHGVRSGSALVISEETPLHWRHRCQKLGLGDQIQFLCRPFELTPSLDQFLDFAESAVKWAMDSGRSLIVIDTLGEFLSGIENNSSALTKALLPFRNFAAQGGAVLILQHPRKASSKPGRAARGSGALTGLVDTVIELDGEGALPADRQRTLRLWSRFDVIPELVYELHPDGTQVAVQPDIPLPTPAETVEQILKHARESQTLTEITDKWPEGHPRVKPPKLLKILAARVNSGELLRTGEGVPASPYYYWPAHRKEVAHPDSVLYRPGKMHETMVRFRPSDLVRSEK